MAIISACLPTFAPLFRMGGDGSSRRGAGSGYDDLNTPTPGSALRSQSHNQYGVHRATASRAVYKGDDEVELTAAERGGDRGERGGELPSGNGGRGQRGIVVDTEVRVSSEEGTL